MKKIDFKIVILIIVLLGFNSNLSVNANTVKQPDKQDSKINQTKEIINYYNEGRSLYKMSDFAAAEKVFLKYIDLAGKTADKKKIANAYYFLGSIESWKSNFYQAIHYHKISRSIFIELDDLDRVASSNNNISSCFYALAEYDSTIVYFKNNIENRASIKTDNTTRTTFFFKKKKRNNTTGSFKRTILESYQGLAILYAKLHNYKIAYGYLQDGIKYAEETGSPHLLADLYYTAGNLFLNNHVNKDIALDYLQKAKAIFTEENNWDYVNLANLSIGKVLHKTGNDSLAMNYFRSVTLEVSSRNPTLKSQANHMIGMVYKSDNQYDSALVYFQKSIDVMCVVCPEIQIHNTFIEAGKSHLFKGNSQQAFYYFNKAKDIAIESESGLEMVKSFEELANYYQTIHRTDSAIQYFIMAHKMAIDLGLLGRIKSSSESLSNIYYSKREFQISSDYLKLSNQMNDSLASIERYNEIAKLEMRFEIEKREEERKLEAQLLQSEIAKQKLIRNSFIAGIILFIIITIAILRAYRRKKKDNKLLEKQKKDIQKISNQLQESGKRKLDFFTNISHEIRTPLTLIKSPLERILNTDKKNVVIDSQLQIALYNTNKLRGLVNQILDLQKLDEKLLRLDLSEFEIIAFCQEIIASFEGYCYQSRCKLIFDSNVSEAMVSFDQTRLQAIINNLLSNAFKFNKEDGFVKLNLEVSASFIKLEIEDSGIGISKENLIKLGERYYQVEQSKASVEGTGIGLAYVKELVELMKGNIEIASIENEGTSVIISLPCDEIKIQQEKPVSIEIKKGEQVFEDLEQQISDDVENALPRILIIEDNFELRLFLNDLFAEFYQVISAKDGDEGKELALKYIPDLIISDIMMPGIKGNELCKLLKNDINTSHITIILFTAKGSPDSIVDGYDCGADDYIVKPFDTDLLVKKVKNIIATGENTRKQFSFKDIERTNSVYSEFDKKFLKNCMSEIKENLDNSHFTVEILAEKMSVHRRTLLRKFNALTGKSPVDLIRHNRMSHAADLIKKNYRVNEVALMVGYEDPKRFSQAFKQFHGVSPSAFI